MAVDIDCKGDGAKGRSVGDGSGWVALNEKFSKSTLAVDSEISSVCQFRQFHQKIQGVHLLPTLRQGHDIYGNLEI